MNEKMKKALLRAVAVAAAAALTVSLSAHFRDGALKASEEDEPAEISAVEETQEVVVQEVPIEEIPEEIVIPEEEALPAESEEEPAAEAAEPAEEAGETAQSEEAETEDPEAKSKEETEPECTCEAAEDEPHAYGCPLYVEPEEAAEETAEEEALPELDVVMTVTVMDGGELAYGKHVRLTAVVSGAEESEVDYMWFYSVGGSDWIPIGSNSPYFDLILDETNGQYSWKVSVDRKI